MPTRPLTIVTWNIHGAIGRDRRREPARIAEVLAEIAPDLVALQEVPLGGSRGSDALEPIARTLGMTAIAGPGIDGPELRFGNALLSRHPIESSRRLDLAFGCAEPRCALDAALRVDGQPVRMIATHLGLRPVERREQVRRLLRAILTGVAEDADDRARRSPAERAARDAHAAARAGVPARPRLAGFSPERTEAMLAAAAPPAFPIAAARRLAAARDPDADDGPLLVLAGDLNEWLPWGRPLRWLDEVFGAQPGAPATFPSVRPVLALDHVRVRPPRRLLRVRVHATPLARLASDHLPLVAEVAPADEQPA